MDGPAASPQGPLFKEGRAACHKQHRDFIALGVHYAADGIGRPDTDMDHHGLGPAGDHGVSMGHADDEIFMRADDRCREVQARQGLAGIGLCDGRRVRATVDEKIVDALLFQQGQKSLCDGFGLRQDVRLLPFHGLYCQGRLLCRLSFEII